MSIVNGTRLVRSKNARAASPVLVRRTNASPVTVFGEPTVVPTGVVQHDAGRKTLVYFLDPDGVIIELAEYRA